MLPPLLLRSCHWLQQDIWFKGSASTKPTRAYFFKKKNLFFPFLIGGSELWLSGFAASVLSILAVGAWLVGDAAAAPQHREAGRVLLSQLTEGW